MLLERDYSVGKAKGCQRGCDQEKAKSPFNVLEKLKKDQNIEVKDKDFEDDLDTDELKKEQQQ